MAPGGAMTAIVGEPPSKAAASSAPLPATSFRGSQLPPARGVPPGEGAATGSASISSAGVTPPIGNSEPSQPNATAPAKRPSRKTGLPLIPWAMLERSSPWPATSTSTIEPCARAFGCTPSTRTLNVSTRLPANTVRP
jgi:hypothetical protein